MMLNPKDMNENTIIRAKTNINKRKDIVCKLEHTI